MQTAEVIQADRDIAAAYYYSAGGSPEIAAAIREGQRDDWFRVQFFARHRIAALENAAALSNSADLGLAVRSHLQSKEDRNVI